MAKSKSTVPGGGVKVDRKAILAVVVAVALCAAAWFMFTAPAREKAAAAAGQRTTAEATLAQHQAALAQLKAGALTQAQRLLEQSQALDAQLPSKADKVVLVAEVDALAKSTGLVMDQMNPGATVTGGGNLNAATFDVHVTGSRSGTIAFLAALTSRSPMMTVAKATVTSGADATSTSTVAGSHSMTLTLHVWYVAAPELSGQPAA